jgi:hypothetical protein
VPGFGNEACGSTGAACSNCTTQAATCNALASPRVCSNAGGKCPAAYGACPAGTQTPVPAQLTKVCSTADLDAVGAACTGGPDTGTCRSAFLVLATTNPSCSTCLRPFDVPFAQLSGLYRCASAFVDAACNQATGCAINCQDASCNQCLPAFDAQCRDRVNDTGGQCKPFVQATGCTAAPLGPGQLCSSATYASFGEWLRAVGDHFCGDGP